jgi:hypothetical protein
MPFRFQCSNCQGTFDVATQAAPPTCVYPGARKGTMSLLRQGLFGGFAPLVPEGAASGCLDGPQGLTVGQFRDGTFSIPHFVPYTYYGNFDCSYRPKVGFLVVEFAVYLNFKLDAGKAGEVLTAWTEQEKRQFQLECQQAVDNHWQGKYLFRCTKPGWTEFVARPVFRLNFLPRAGNANYNIDVYKDRRPFELTRGVPDPLRPKCNGALVPAQLSTNNIDAVSGGSFQSFHAQTMDIPFKAMGVLGAESTRLTNALRDTGAANVSFEAGTARLTLAAQGSLRRFANACQQRYASTPAYPIRIKGRGATTVLGDQRAAAVETELRTILPATHPLPRQTSETVAAVVPPPVPAPVPAPRTVHDDSALDAPRAPRARSASLGGGSSPAPVAAPEHGATLSLDPNFGGLGTLTTDVPHYSYNVFAHEFGHMMGLPDEYVNDVGAGAKARLQTNFQQLAHQAGVACPEFGSHTSSLMSEGSDVLPHHFVTLWNALCSLTHNLIEPQYWRIHEI